jgi:hypothetical protein
MQLKPNLNVKTEIKSEEVRFKWINMSILHKLEKKMLMVKCIVWEMISEIRSFRTSVGRVTM